MQMLERLPSCFSGLNVEQRFVHFTGVGVQDTEKKRKEKVAPTGISQCG